MWYGEIYLEYCPGAEYTCPKYCQTDHIHLTGDCNENKEKQEAYKQRLKPDAKRTQVQSNGNPISGD